MPQFPFPEGDGFGGIAFHEVSCRRFVFVLGHDGDRYAEYGRLSRGGSLFEDGPRVTSASTRSTASPSSCPVPSLPFPSLPCLPHRAEGSTNSLLYNLQRLSVSRVLPGGTMAGSAIHAGSAPELPCRWPTTVVCSRMFMTRAAGGLVLAAPFSNRVFQEFLLLLHEAWATVFALSRVLWGSEQLFLRCKRTSIAHDVKIT